jgi:hypothetical protein
MDKELSNVKTIRKLLDKNLATSESKALFVSAVSLLMFFVGYCLTYVKTQYLAQPLGDSLLYRADDPGYVAGSFPISPILGVHRFGDYLTTTSWALLDAPYSESEPFPSVYGPMAMFISRGLGLMPANWGVFVLSGLTAVALISVSFYLLKSLTFPTRVITVVALLLLTRPFLLTLDRGNLQGLVVAAEILALIFIARNEKIRAAITITLLASMKFYPIVLVTLFVIKRQLKAAALTVLASSVIILLGLTSLSGAGLFDGIRGLLKGIAIQGELFPSGGSASAWLYRFAQYLHLVDYSPVSIQVIRMWSLVVTVLILTAVIIGIKTGRILGTRLTILVLASTTLVVPVSWAYNLTWVTFALFLLISREDWKTGVLFLDTYALLGFIPSIALMPVLFNSPGTESIGIAELWTFPYLLGLTIIWLSNKKLEKQREPSL